MSHEDDLNACAAQVRRGDPGRFLACMAAPVAARRVLLPLYAMNLEVARAPWVTAEPLIAQMRLQWWHDALSEIAAGGPVRRHEVVTPLARVLTPQLATALQALVAARRTDTERTPFADTAALWDYLDATAGTLLWVAARALGPADERTVRMAGQAGGLAAYLCAIPALEAAGRQPLPDGRAPAIAALARDGQTRLRTARAQGVTGPARVAMLALWQTDAILHRAAARPGLVGQDRLAPVALGARLGLMLRKASGRW